MYHYDNEINSPDMQLITAPLNITLGFLVLFIGWFVTTIVRYVVIWDEYKKIEKEGMTFPIEKYDARLGVQRKTHVREKYIEQNGKWVQVNA